MAGRRGWPARVAPPPARAATPDCGHIGSGAGGTGARRGNTELVRNRALILPPSASARRDYSASRLPPRRPSNGWRRRASRRRGSCRVALRNSSGASLRDSAHGSAWPAREEVWRRGIAAASNRRGFHPAISGASGYLLATARHGCQHSDARSLSSSPRPGGSHGLSRRGARRDLGPPLAAIEGHPG